MKCPTPVSKVLPLQAVPLEGAAQPNSFFLPRAGREPLLSAPCSAVPIRGMACLQRRVTLRRFASPWLARHWGCFRIQRSFQN